jgi:hypothetical protein
MAIQKCALPRISILTGEGLSEGSILPQLEIAVYAVS